MFEPARVFGGGQRLRNEGFASAGAPPIANSPKADTQIIVPAHDASKCDVRLALTSCEDSEYAPRTLAAHIVSCR
jgi:hypothetical protein